MTPPKHTAHTPGARCGQWDGKQCRATKNLTSCAIGTQQGSYLKVPDKVVVFLCPKHFQLLIPKRARWAEAAIHKAEEKP